MKPRRNDPCVCGSGKKYKRCCGAEEGSSRVEETWPAKSGQLLAMLNAGRYAEVESMAGRLAALHPRAGLIWKILSAALAAQGKNALPALERATQLLPNDAEAHSNWGNALRAARLLDAAAAAHHQAIAIEPDYAAAHNNLGSALRDLGRLEEAVTSYRRALQLKPDLALAADNLGRLLHELGRPGEALEYYGRALALKPRDHHLHDRLGSALRELKKPEQAVENHRRAIEIKPDFPAAHSNMGNALRDLGRHEEAVDCCRRAIEINPGCAGFHNNLGNALLDLGRPKDAVESYRRALEISPDSATAHSNLGSALRDLGLLDAAESNYRRALDLKPGSAEMHNNLAMVLRLQNRASDADRSCWRALELNPDLPAAIVLFAKLHADKGCFSGAEQLLKRAIAIDPQFAEAWSGIVNLRKMTGDDADWLATTQRMVAEELPPRQEIHLRYAMGKYFDDLRDHAQAFSNYRRANELTVLHREKHDRQRLTRYVDHAVRAFDRAWVEHAQKHGIESTRPVFIVGMPRSGTTLAEQILAAHPRVFGANEVTFWSMAAATREPALLSGDGQTTIRELAGDYLRLLDGLSADAPRVVDKMPANVFSLGLIHAALPNARIIHMQRHPIDTCLSIYFQDFNSNYSFANDLSDLAHYHREYSRIMAHWRSVVPEHAILDVPYEALVVDPEAWSRRMLDFIGLSWDPLCLDFQKTDRSVTTLSNWQVRQKISKSSVERWRNYERWIGPLRSLSE